MRCSSGRARNTERRAPVDDAMAELLASEPERLTPADIARLRGWNRVRAWRWLKSLHDKYGDEIVLRRDRQYTIGKRQFADVMWTRQSPVDPRIQRQLREMADQIREQDRRLDVHARALAKLHLL